MKHEYNQLVRDKIPEIIRTHGRSCETRTLTDPQEIQKALTDKLIEKAQVFSNRPSEDELSDIYELLSTIVEKFDFESMHIDYLRMQNKEQKGSYSGSTLLVSFEEEN